MKILKKTKIIATIGPVSQSKEVIKQLIDAGMNVARLNFSHGDYPSHQEKIDTLKELIAEGENIAILLDTKGPEVRTGDFENGKVTYTKDSVVRVSMTPCLGNLEKFSVSYPKLYDDLDIGSIIRIDDGRLSMMVVEKDDAKRELVMEVLNTHTISNKKSLVAPLSRLSMPFVSEKDYNDIIFGCKNGVDFIAASFTRTAQDILDIKKILKEQNCEHVQVIAKIENQEGYDNADAILDVADGLMVARGDLGVEVAPELVPIIQRDLVKRSRNKGKTVIIATHMLDSMQNNPSPTRAEVSDVANAVFEVCDSVMLSGESASGKFPVESVRMEARIASQVENVLSYHKQAEKIYEVSTADYNNAIAYSVANTVILSAAKLIVCFTKTGGTARRISRFRPYCPIISISSSHIVTRSLCLTWGVYGHYLESYAEDIHEFERIACEIAKDYGVKVGETIVITGGDGIGGTNFMKILVVK